MGDREINGSYDLWYRNREKCSDWAWLDWLKEVFLKELITRKMNRRKIFFFFNGVETATGKSMKGRMSMSIDRRD